MHKEEPSIKRFFCYTQASNTILARTASNLTPLGTFKKPSQALLHHGFNIIERGHLPRAAEFACSLIVAETIDGKFIVKKDVYDWSTSPMYVDLIQKCNNSHPFTSEEKILYSTDPNPFVRAIFQHYNNRV